MYHRLMHHWRKDYTLTDRLEAPHGVEPLDLSDRFLAEQFVAELHEDPFSRQELYDIACRHVLGLRAGHTEKDVLARMALEISLGSILVFEGRAERPGSLVSGPEPAEPEAPPAQLAKAHSFAVKVVDDRSGRPIPDVKVEVTLVDGATRLCTTDGDGRVEIQDVAPGNHGLSCPVGGLMLARTLEFVSVGESPDGGKAPGAGKKVPGKTIAREAAADHRPVRSIAGVETHKVRSGDTLQTIASAHQLTRNELAHFNWGVHSLAEIERRLRDEVGCRKRDGAGRYVFDDGDDPGIIYIPKKWGRQGLAADQCHTIRVRPVIRKLPDLRFLYQLDPHAPNVQNDTLTLQTEDGSWSHELPVSELSEVHPGWVELVFPEPPSGQAFDLVQDPKDDHEPFYVFRGRAYGDLHEAQAEQEELDSADEDGGAADGGGDGEEGRAA